jgi:hypothetical protein
VTCPPEFREAVVEMVRKRISRSPRSRSRWRRGLPERTRNLSVSVALAGGARGNSASRQIIDC